MTLAMLGQTASRLWWDHADPPERNCNHAFREVVRIEPMDWAFQDAVEQFVMDSANDGNSGSPLLMQALIPVRLLGSSSYSVRVNAEHVLGAGWPRGERWLFWGLRSRDFHIRSKCEIMLRQFARCAGCADGKTEYDLGMHCTACNDTRHYWPWPFRD